MKQTLAAIAFVVLAAPAFADNRATPYEQPQFDRGGPGQAIPHGRAAVGGSTGAATYSWSWATGAWANDHHFIAPPQ